MRFLVAGYGEDHGGSAEGIGVLVAGDPDSPLASGALSITGDAARVAGSPSWLASNPRADVVYAALEGRGEVRAFERVGESIFVPLGDAVSVGEAPCHIAVAPDASALVVSCYLDGRVVRVALDERGSLGRVSVAPGARDPYVEAEVATAESPERAALRDIVGAEHRDLLPLERGALTRMTRAPPGPRTLTKRAFFPVMSSRRLISGSISFDCGMSTRRDSDFGSRWRCPRAAARDTVVWHPSGNLFVVTERTGEVFTLMKQDATWHVSSGLSTQPIEGDAAAEIALSADAEHVYVGMRGSDTISTLDVRDGGSRLEVAAMTDAGVAWPRHHTVVLDTLLVAGQHSDEVVSHSLHPRTGVPGGVRRRAVVPSPTQLLALR